MTSNFQAAINERIEAFIADINDLAKKAAMETLEAALEQSMGGAGGRRGGGGLGRRKGGKRSPEEIAAIAEELFEFIQKNPGERMEDIAKALNSTSKDLTLPLKKLQADKRIRVEGQKRATSYYVQEPKKRRARRRKKAS